MAVMMGTVLGFLSGLGIGGGSLLMVYLTLVVGFSQATARGINLLFYLPSALIALALRWKEGAVDVRQIWPAVVGGCVSAAVLTLFGAGAESEILRKCFGGLLMVTGLREIFFGSRRAA